MELQKALPVIFAFSQSFSQGRTDSSAHRLIFFNYEPGNLITHNPALKGVVSDAALLQEIFSIRPSLNKVNQIKTMMVPLTDQVTRLRKKLKLLQEKRSKTKARSQAGGASSINNPVKPVINR